ncbi:MAG: enoyl-CoA hydratase/isomerase family protein [Janthinobacterium lividum]
MDVQDLPPSLEMKDGLATITLRRPSQHNRIDPDDLAVLIDHLDRVASDPANRVLVFRGTGERTFSSGYTLQALITGLRDDFEEMLDRVESFPLPTICALRGSVYGGATDLALCCDFRLGARGIGLLMPAAKFGLHYYPGGMRRYVTRLGLSNAKRLFLTALKIDAEEMLRMGYLTELVDAEALEDKVASYVAALMLGEPQAMSSMKKQLNAIADNAPDALTREYYMATRTSPEVARRVTEFLKK